ncbi:protein kinase C and casein kinase substrate in neurons protein 1 [Latimeria chalumnae]|uniref:Si:ch211-51c14.1 n=1 Tax=Latimeria chalumnae TaxID=7897 RepID=H3B011_LATCH|nr:PREDICTED: protein kinase C and casein kinase substrate in neurons protein 1-like [Latimeria chalumnae]|eukprot:XP_005990976.1 PREDICTED: protein kinase C and casein kinase substrate in neurons protein 1-like [Latimeria chalumnae]
MSMTYSDVGGEEATSNSFWMPGNYHSTVRRIDEGYRVCDDIIMCFQERAKIEKQYALQMEEWSKKWKPLVDESPMYGSLHRAWQAFMRTTDRLSDLHQEIQKVLVAEDGEKVRSWQREMYHKKLFGGFKETYDIDNGFFKAQKPWAKKLKKLEKTRQAFHKERKKEHLSLVRENSAKGNPDISPEKLKKIQEEREKCSQEVAKVKQRYEKALEDLNKYSPKYMEEMETVFDQSQQFEQKRIVFLKQVFLSIHRHLDVTNNESIRSTYNDLHQSIMGISDQEDLKLWRNQHGPGMAMNWPQFEEWSPEKDRQIVKKREKKEAGKVTLRSITATESSVVKAGLTVPGVRVRAIYDYSGQEADELSFKAGEELTKIEEEDEQGWCKGVTERGQVGLYPANYMEVIQ